MPSGTTVSFEQFEKYEDGGMRHELIRGEHVIRPPANVIASFIRQKLHDLLRPYVREHDLGGVYIAAGFKVSSDTFLNTDASLVRRAQLARTEPDGYFEGAPALAIEVASESYTAAQLDLKMELYFAQTAPRKSGWCFRRRGGYAPLSPTANSETLVAPPRSALFPGWTASAGAIFAT
jgi:Uma2 family endonuclease